MTLRLRTFGAVYIERDGAPLGGAHSQRRRLVLLAYLASISGVPVAREKLIALLWPESDEASGRHSLSQLLYALRQDLGAGTILVDQETVRLDPAALPSDAQAFADALRAGRLEDAVGEYRGAFLEGFHIDEAPELDRWIEEERARRLQACARALDRLAETAEQSRDWHRAVEWLRRRVALDPTHGRATAHLMQALSAIGDRDGALRTARVYEALVRGELEAEPDRAVVQLAEKLRGPDTAPPRASLEELATVPANKTTVTTAIGATASPRQSPAVAKRGTSSVLDRRPRIILPRRLGRWALGATAVTVLALLIALSPWRRSGFGRRLMNGAPVATVVVGDLEGPDAVLALAVREALRAELVNTPGVLLTSDAGMRELELLMRLPSSAPLHPPQLLALATRGGAHVAVAGSVLPVGTGAQIVLELLDPASGRSIRTFTERPVDGTSTLSAVERLARAIGEAVTRTPRGANVRPLPAVTTSSLEALKSYALARQTAASGKRREAVAPAEWALTHDSTFVLAHYFLGDLLWFIDEQRHSDAHLTRAFELLATVPPREQLVIRARYEQLVRDQPDSALAYWQLLREASPEEVLAYEGRAWTLRALGRHEEAAASADTAMTLDPGAILPNVTNAMYSLLSVGDTAGAIAVAGRIAPRFPDALVEARFFATLFRDPTAAVAWADSTKGPEHRHWRRHLTHVSLGDLTRARLALDSVLADNVAQWPPNAMIHQGLLELVLGERRDGSGGAASAAGRRAAAQYARDALAWTRQRDLSPPAIGRLSERIADLAARAGDEATVRATISLVNERDRGRNLRTYVMARRTLAAALAYARGDYANAARLADAARHGVYFSRSLATIVQLESDAHRAAGELAYADSLTRLLTTHQIVDGHFEAWAVLRAMAVLAAGKTAATTTVPTGTSRD